MMRSYLPLSISCINEATAKASSRPGGVKFNTSLKTDKSTGMGSILFAVSFNFCGMSERSGKDEALEGEVFEFTFEVFVSVFSAVEEELEEEKSPFRGLAKGLANADVDPEELLWALLVLLCATPEP